MFDLDTSIRIVGHVLVAVCVETFQLGGIHYMLPPWSCQYSWDFSSRDLFQYMSDISSHYGDLDLLYIFSLCGDHGPLYIFIMEILIYVYCTWRWPHMCYHVSCLFMAMYLQLYAELYYGIMLIGWLVFDLGTFITSLLGWTYNVFRPSYNPSDLIH